MAEAVERTDELVREYLLFRGFTHTLRQLDAEIKADKEKGFRVSCRRARRRRGPPREPGVGFPFSTALPRGRRCHRSGDPRHLAVRIRGPDRGLTSWRSASASRGCSPGAPTPGLGSAARPQ